MSIENIRPHSVMDKQCRVTEYCIVFQEAKAKASQKGPLATGGIKKSGKK